MLNIYGLVKIYGDINEADYPEFIIFLWRGSLSSRNRPSLWFSSRKRQLSLHILGGRLWKVRMFSGIFVYLILEDSSCYLLLYYVQFREPLKTTFSDGGLLTDVTPGM